MKKNYGNDDFSKKQKACRAILTFCIFLREKCEDCFLKDICPSAGKEKHNPTL